jgi:phage FluMu gp28-like protein
VSSSSGILLPYQRRWVEDSSPVKVWVASRQIGKSFALSFEAVCASLLARSDNMILSSSERQAQEVMAKVRKHLRCLGALDSALSPLRETREEIVFPSGSRIISLPANPATVRGFSGNVYLDEFAFHTDSREIWRAMYPTVTRGYKVRITSTPNGKQNMFFELASGSGGLGEGSLVSRHRTDIHDALSEGLDIDLASLRSGISDPEAWAQEYECNFLDSATALITYEMIEGCTSPDATVEQLVKCEGETYLGVDVGRKHDLTVFWLLERVGDVLWTRSVREMRAAPFSVQREALYSLMEAEGVRRCSMDSTGIGTQLSEEAVARFGSRVEPVHFTQASKEDMALRARRAFEDRTVRVPVDRSVREDLHSLSRSVTASGATRYSAARIKGGHADRFWALALALEAASGGGLAPVEYSSVIGRGRDRGQRGW